MTYSYMRFSKSTFSSVENDPARERLQAMEQLGDHCSDKTRDLCSVTIVTMQMEKSRQNKENERS